MIKQSNLSRRKKINQFMFSLSFFFYFDNTDNIDKKIYLTKIYSFCLLFGIIIYNI